MPLCSESAIQKHRFHLPHFPPGPLKLPPWGTSEVVLALKGSL